MKFGEMIVYLGIFVILPTWIIWLIIRAKTNVTNKQAEVALAAIENNSNLDMKTFFKKMNPSRQTMKERLLNKLLCGAIFTIFGVCIYLALAVFFIIDGWDRSMFIGLSFAAVPSLGVGIAFLINYFVGRKVLKQEMEAELRNMQMEE